MTDHLSRLQLLRYVDGELSKSDTAVVAEHIQSCWSCRCSLEQLTADISDIFEANNRVFVPALPPPPKPWPGLESRLLRIEEQQKPSVWTKIKTIGSPVWSPARFATATIVILLIVALVTLPVQPLSAEEVMQRVAAADVNRLNVSANQVVRQRVQISKTARGASRAVTTSIDGWEVGRTTYWGTERASVASDLLDRYKAAGITTALPLSSAALQVWIHMVGTKPTATRERGDMVLVRAASDRGAFGIREVKFQVHSRDWHVEDLHLAFADATFDIVEDDFAVVDKRNAPAGVLAGLEPMEVNVGHEMRDAASTRIARPAGSPDDLEVSVRYTLHRIGADLGEGIDVSKSRAGGVVVYAWGVSSNRRAQLAALFGDRPNIRLEFQPPQAEARTARDRLVVLPKTSAGKVPDERLIEYFGSPEAEEDYTRAVLRTSTAVLSHFYALNMLAERWPAERSESLSPRAKGELNAIVRDHARQLRTQVDELSGQLAPLLNKFGQTIPSTSQPDYGVAWRQSSHIGLEEGRRLDHTLRSLMTTSDDPASVDVAIPLLKEQLSRLDRTANELLLGCDD